MPASPIDTAKVSDFRVLHFTLPVHALDAARSLVAAEAAGTLRHAGNWTLSQTLTNLGALINYPYDGYPPELSLPWFVRAFAPLMRMKYLKGPLPRGYKIPNIDGGTVGADDGATSVALARFEQA